MSVKTAEEHALQAIKRVQAKTPLQPLNLNADIIENVAQQIEIYGKKIAITAEWKMAKLAAVIERCMPEESDEINPKGVIGAIAELNKMQGHYAPTKTVSGLYEARDAMDVRNTLIDVEQEEY